MSQKIKLFVAIPTMGTIVDDQTYKLRELERRYGDKIEFIYPELCVRRMFHDFARNEMVEQFLESEADILWFLDSDVSPPPHLLDLIVCHGDKWKVAGATYPVFMSIGESKEPRVVYTAYKQRESGRLSLGPVPREGTEFVDGLATGCLFIKREVFSQLSKPYFEFKYNTESREMTEGEDLGFVVKLNKLGIKFFTDYSMICRHRKTIDLLDVNNYAIEYANNTVLAYDREIRTSIESTISASYDKGYRQALADLEAKIGAGSPSKLIIPNPTIWLK